MALEDGTYLTDERVRARSRSRDLPLAAPALTKAVRPTAVRGAAALARRAGCCAVLLRHGRMVHREEGASCGVAPRRTALTHVLLRFRALRSLCAAERPGRALAPLDGVSARRGRRGLDARHSAGALPPQLRQRLGRNPENAIAAHLRRSPSRCTPASPSPRACSPRRRMRSAKRAGASSRSESRRVALS